MAFKRSDNRTRGIHPRHARHCEAPKSGRCTCTPKYEAQVFHKPSGRKLRKTCRTLSEAKAWRQDALRQVSQGTAVPSSRLRLGELVDEVLAKMASGVLLQASGKPYKPSTVRSYRRAFNQHLRPRIGGVRITDLAALHLHLALEELLAAGVWTTAITNAFGAVRLALKDGRMRGLVAQDVDHFANLNLPSWKKKEREIVNPSTARALIEAAPAGHRVFWALAFLAGLRVGEILGLRWTDVDLERGVLRVRRSWDPLAGPVEPKSKAGTRTVPICALLRHYLECHQELTRGSHRYVVQQRTTTWIRRAANNAWAEVNLPKVTPHIGRHMFASVLIDAGVSLKELTVYMGHGSIQTSLDLYGHLMPGGEQEAIRTLNAYLMRKLVDPVAHANPEIGSDDAATETGEDEDESATPRAA